MKFFNIFNSLSYSRIKHFHETCKFLTKCENSLAKIGFANFCSKAEAKFSILGIETSCDDTGAAIINHEGTVLGDALQSQTRITVELGGVLPPVAQELHRQHIDGVVKSALSQANMQAKDVDAIAVTVEPGMALSLGIGVGYAEKMAVESGLPLIPIHHMEAHALTARMLEKIDFPFLVLLVSGGHCLLAVARGVDDFLLLGTSLDCSPGDALDKLARRMKLKNLPQCDGLSGGASIELLARNGDPLAFPSPDIMVRLPNCNFSFSAMRQRFEKLVRVEEERQEIVASAVLSNIADICASLQYMILKHIAKRVQRAFLFCAMNELLPPENRTLVMSGGVGSNQFLRGGLEKVCSHYNSRLVCPPPHLCTDNGIMVAWNGVEKWRLGRGIVHNPQNIVYKNRSQLGVDMMREVSKCSYKKMAKLDLL